LRYQSRHNDFSSNEHVAGQYEKITHENRNTSRVILTIVWPGLKIVILGLLHSKKPQIDFLST